MEHLIIIFSFMSCFVVGKNVPDSTDPEVSVQWSSVNSTDPNKDMYVIHAMVYQVGIITNKTDETLNGTDFMGNQEAVTFYHTNGSNIDLSKMPTPLMTNVTAQRMVGVAPATKENMPASHLQWSDLNNLIPQQPGQEAIVRDLANAAEPRLARAVDNDETNPEDFYPFLERLFKRSLNPSNSDAGSENKTPVKIVSGAAVVPQEAGVSSIVIPPLLTFNNNFSEIPVPIPNTSVVQYAKVNTVVHSTP